jgi:cytochrome c
MRAMLLVLAAAGTLAAGGVQAQQVLKDKGCLGCHEMDKKKVGPAFKDVAAKYKDDKSAEGRLIAKLKEGKGHLKIAASDAELKAAVGQVLAAK